MLQVIDPTTKYTDLLLQGQPGYLAAAILDTNDGPLVIDPGPTTCLGYLEAGLAEAGYRVKDVLALLLTHIHLDHAGVSGRLAAIHPELKVYVHPRGTRHLIDPTKLVASATRLYGEAMDQLWGDILPIPSEQVEPVSNDETLILGGRSVVVLETQGHAQHQVAYLDQSSGTIFVGDAAGERFEDTAIVLPVTPPPDIHVPQMLQSTAAIRALDPTRLFLTHYGPFDDVLAHLDQHDQWLLRWEGWVAADIAKADHSDEEFAKAFTARVLDEYRTAVGPTAVVRVHPDGIESSWYGLARWLRHSPTH